MRIYEKPKEKWKRYLRRLSLLVLPAAVCLLVFLEIRQVSEQTLKNEKTTLEQALKSSAVHAYAMEGRYPESLSALLDAYHIHYDDQKFVIEYTPNGANLFPSIFVLPLSQSGGRS